MSEQLYLSPWTSWTLAAAAVSLLGLVLLRALRERKVVALRAQAGALALRLTLVGALLWIALNPTALLPDEETGRPRLSVLVDASRSMSVNDVEQSRRIEAALTALRASMPDLEQTFALDLRTFSDQALPAKLDLLNASSADGDESDLGAALITGVEHCAGSPRPGGVLILSDGRATRDGCEDAARLALARGVPVWACCLGGEVARRDLWMETAGGEILAFSESDVELRGLLRQVGYPDRSFHVELLGDGGEVLDRCEALPGPDGSAAVSFSVRAPAAGETRYLLRVPPEQDEAETANNERAVFLRSVGAKVRVLLIEGQPHWDAKFLIQSLKRNPRVHLTAICRLAEGRQFGVLSAEGDEQRDSGDLLPRTLDDLAQYDAVLLGRGCEPFVAQGLEALLASFVADHGGSLVFYRGKSYGGRLPALSRFEPVVWDEGARQEVRLGITPQGFVNPVFDFCPPERWEALLDALPPLDRAQNTGGVKPLAVVLARAGAPDDEQAPELFSYQQFGQGRVVLLNAGGLWRWSFRPRGADEDEQFYDHFWSGLLRWLLSGSDFLSGHDVALRSDRRVYTDEQVMRFLIRTRGLDAAAYRPALVIQGADGTTTELEPRPQPGGVYLAEAGPFAAGSYTVRLENNLGKPQTLALELNVVSASIENRVLSADPQRMQELARIAEGRVITPAEIADLPQIVRDWHARRRLAERKLPLWDRAWLIGLCLAALGVEWFLRRREGLL